MLGSSEIHGFDGCGGQRTGSCSLYCSLWWTKLQQSKWKWMVRPFIHEHCSFILHGTAGESTVLSRSIHQKQQVVLNCSSPLTFEFSCKIPFLAQLCRQTLSHSNVQLLNYSCAARGQKAQFIQSRTCQHTPDRSRTRIPGIPGNSACSRSGCVGLNSFDQWRATAVWHHSFVGKTWINWLKMVQLPSAEM